MIADEFKLQHRASIYRHAHALNLVSRRDRNLQAFLRRYLERADEAPVTAGAIMQAVTLLARMNKRGELVDRDDQVSAQDLFDQMNPDEREAYGKDGTLPSWFTQLSGAEGPQGSESTENE